MSYTMLRRLVLILNTGDFQQIIDFSASLEDGERSINLPWATEDGELQYLDTLPDEG
jgi:hypothetical protein